LQYISPSDFVSNQKCPARSYLNRNSKNKINRSAQSYFGSFCHLFLNKSNSLFHENTPSKNELKEYWELEYENYCKDLLDKDPNFHLKHPLKSFVKDFIYVRTNIINRLEQRTPSDQRENTAKVNSEYHLNVDGISASIDLIYKNQDYVKLVDFKFGNIFDDVNLIKELYQKQLYIYAAMYYLQYGIEPSVLSICDRQFEEYKLEIKPMEYCISLFEELKVLNDEIANINTEDDLLHYARPEEENCKYCNVKIDCSSYWKSGLYESENHLDIIGKILDIKKGLDGITLTLKTVMNSNIKIFRIPNKMEDQLNRIETVALINLFKAEDNGHDNYFYGKYSDIVFI
jgi:hypothetical protein